MSQVAFADVAHQSLSFSRTDPVDALILKLIDTKWIQRLRDISQTANTKLVYMFSEHSRFGHSLGAAYLAKLLMDRLTLQYSSEIERYRMAVTVCALLHDLGHLAPGSHTAFKAWFPGQPDLHEQIAVKIVRQDDTIRALLEKTRPGLIDEVCAIMSESPGVPAWTWQIVSGGGWNVDRGNWCIVDSVMAGVSYGKYNISALTDAMVLTPDKQLALNESRLDAMMHFAISRHAMYRQIYEHRVILAVDTLNRAIAMRARDLSPDRIFCDAAMREVLTAGSPDGLSVDCVYAMRESWWRYHLAQWSRGDDRILADLSARLINRRLFKTVRLRPEESEDELTAKAAQATESNGFDPRYYLHKISTSDMHTGDRHQSMLVLMENGGLLSLTEAEPLYSALVFGSKDLIRAWLALPEEAKRSLGRVR